MTFNRFCFRENIQKLNRCVNWHISEFRHLSKYGHCPVLSDHFNKSMCKRASIKV